MAMDHCGVGNDGEHLSVRILLQLLCLCSVTPADALSLWASVEILPGVFSNAGPVALSVTHTALVGAASACICGDDTVKIG